MISGLFVSLLLEVEPSLQMMFTLFFSDMAVSFQTTTCTMYLVLGFVWDFLMHHIVDLCLAHPITSSHLKREVMYEIIPISLE